MKIQILGSGCSKCKLLYEHTEQAIKDAGIQADIEKVTDFKEIMKFNIMSTPGLVINGKVVSAGKLLTKEEIVIKIMNAQMEETN